MSKDLHRDARMHVGSRIDPALQVDHLPGYEFRDGEPDDVCGCVDVGNDAACLGAGESVRFGAEAEHDLVTVDRVDVEVDGGPGAAGGREPVEQRPGG